MPAPSSPASRDALVNALVPAAHQQQAQPAAQPVQVLAVQMLDVVDRVVEVRLLAALAPAVPGRRVVVAGQADGQREDVGALEREVDRVKGAEADAGHWRPCRRMNGTTWSRIHDS
jgi:hypothetical protein